MYSCVCIYVKGVVKLLEVNIACHGHDSERLTDNREITSDALTRNFIVAKSARVSVAVMDAEDTGELLKIFDLSSN